MTRILTSFLYRSRERKRMELGYALMKKRMGRALLFRMCIAFPFVFSFIFPFSSFYLSLV